MPLTPILQDPEKQKNLSFTCSMLKETAGISFLYYDENLNAVNYGSDWEKQLRNFFLLNCPFDPKQLLDTEDTRPLLYTDDLSLCWIVQPLSGMRAFIVGGPVVESDLNYHALQKQLSFHEMSVSSRIAFMKLLNAIPVTLRTSLTKYALMLHYSIYEESGEIRLLSAETEKHYHADTEEKIRSIPGSHGSRTLELTMLSNVRNGIFRDYSDPNLMSDQEVGVLSKGDPLRQAKNMIIAQTTLVSRAALDGGMSVEDSFSLSDYYIQKVELAETTNEVYRISIEMLHSYTQAVHDLKEQSYSSIVSYTISYVNKHIEDDINLKEIGAAIGYAPYYIADCFHKETGQTLKAYIQGKKIEQAKILLRSTTLPVQEISDRLSFTSPAYFTTRFRNVTGMSPGEYRKSTIKP